MRPDYTLSIWPDDFNEDEAEQQELILHIHFDAKYRVDRIDQVFGKSDKELGTDGVERELRDEGEEQVGGIYKRGDLLKMHAYKDAIRRTVGAYVIYPGSSDRTWQEFQEVIPGIGAFSLRPDNNGDSGTHQLREFIRDVAEHISDRATIRERESYHLYTINKNPEKLSFQLEKLERVYGGLDRHPPPAETMVLVAFVRDGDHLDWVRSNHKYNLDLAFGNESIALDSDLAGSRYLVLFKNTGEPITELFVISGQPQLNSDEELIAEGLSGKLLSPLYLTFNVEEHPDFVGSSWDYSAISHKPFDQAKLNPLTVSLQELMFASS